MSTKREVVSVILLVAVLLSPLATIVWAAPVLPAGFWGTVTVGSDPASSGAVVSAWINDIQYAQTTTVDWSGQAGYSLDVPGDDPETPEIEGGIEGETIVFKIDGQDTEQTAIWHTGTNIQLDLTQPAAVPQIESITPNTGDPDTLVHVHIRGRHTQFAAGMTVDFGAGITVSDLNVLDAINATVDLTIAPAAWPGPRTVTVTTGTDIMTQPNAFTVNGGLEVYVPDDVTGAMDTQVLVPIYAPTALTGLEIYTYKFTMTFDPQVLRATGTSKAGTLSENCVINDRHDTPGQITVNCFAMEPLRGEGTLLNLTFNVTETARVETDLTFNEFVFNEGEPPTITTAGHFTVRPLLISGQVIYGQSFIPQPVPEVTMTLQGPTSHITQTNNDGHYQVEASVRGDYVVTPTKRGAVCEGLSSLDASWIAQYDVGSRPFEPWQVQACDVSNNGACTAYDASVIARYLVGLPVPSEAQVGLWTFTPPTRKYLDLNIDFTEQNYTAHLYGDVTGNWAPCGMSTFQLQATSSNRLTVTLPSLNVSPKAEVEVPINLTGITDTDISAYELTLHFDPTVVTVTAVTKDNSLSTDWMVVENHCQPGIIHIVGYGVESLSSHAALLRISFKVVGELGQETSLTFSKLQLNEGHPAAQPQEGEIRVRHSIFIPLIMSNLSGT